MNRLLSVTAVVVVAMLAGGSTAPGAMARARQSAPAAAPQPRVLLDRYCVGCHNQRTRAGNFNLDDVDVTKISTHTGTWEKVFRKVRAGMMPPSGRPRPDEATQDAFVAWMASELDRTFDAQPNPGRTETFHRLNRSEYRNAVRDLLAVDVEVSSFLPPDDSSYGFDNMAGVLRLSQTLMERYLSAARTVARLAVGSPPPAMGGDTYRVAPDSQQHDRAAGLPFGTRGGTVARHWFPQDGEYQIKLEVAGANNPRDTHRLEVTIDGAQVKLFTLRPKDSREPDPYYDPEGKLEARVQVKGGPHDVGVTFFRKPAGLVEQVRDPFPNPRVSGNDGGPGGSIPFLTSVTVIGPEHAAPAHDTPSRRRIFTCTPPAPSQEARCAREILTKLAHRAYRGLGTGKDVDSLVAFYQDGRRDGGSFDAGIELAIRRLLVDPSFLFRVESAPMAGAVGAGAPAARAVSAASPPSVYRISDLELASRLSFFIWSSIPDDELLNVASQNRLKDPATLERQVRRLLADPRSVALTQNFAGQWLLVRNMGSVRPGDPFALAFDETLRGAMQRETELFFDSIVRDNRPLSDILTADYTFLNERLAQHYGVAGIQGSHFRRVSLPADSPRRGILGQGAVLTVTSHPIRTSPVLRGKWILNNILGTPPPDPPANVPSFPEQRTQAKVQTMRERLSAHRANPVCAACHNMIDPAGFALENFDAIGRWRKVDESYNPIDASGALPDGTKFTGVAELRTALTRRPERFANTVTEKLLTYALGRGLEPYDMTAVRRIVSDTKKDEYRFQSLVLAIARSFPFTMRRGDVAEQPASARLAQ